MMYKSMRYWKCNNCNLGVERRMRMNGQILEQKCECNSEEKYSILYWNWDIEEFRIQPNYDKMTLREFQKRDLAEKGFELDIFRQYI